MKCFLKCWGCIFCGWEYTSSLLFPLWRSFYVYVKLPYLKMWSFYIVIRAFVCSRDTHFASENECRSVVSDSLPPHGLYIVHGILQARILEWVAFPFSRGSSQPRDQTRVSSIAGKFFTSWATREASKICKKLIQFNNKNTNNLIKKWAVDLNRYFPKKTHRWPTDIWIGASHA